MHSIFHHILKKLVGKQRWNQTVSIPSWLESEFKNVVCFLILLLKSVLWHSWSQNEFCNDWWKLQKYLQQATLLYKTSQLFTLCQRFWIEFRKAKNKKTSSMQIWKIWQSLITKYNGLNTWIQIWRQRASFQIVFNLAKVKEENPEFHS